MLDPKTRHFLIVLSSSKRQWISKSRLMEMGVDISVLNIKHLEALNYVEVSIHLDEQYRITPTGETALIEHNRALKSDRKATIALILSALAILISMFSLFSDGLQKRQSQAEDLPQKQQATHREEYRASNLEFSSASGLPPLLSQNFWCPESVQECQEFPEWPGQLSEHFADQLVF